jgi:hypothetical protein
MSPKDGNTMRKIMKPVKLTLYVVGGFPVVAGSIILCLASGASAQDNRPPTPVTIINTPLPVSVLGTLPVSIQGPASVNAGQTRDAQRLLCYPVIQWTRAKVPAVNA